MASELDEAILRALMENVGGMYAADLVRALPWLAGPHKKPWASTLLSDGRIRRAEGLPLAGEGGRRDRYFITARGIAFVALRPPRV